jgi:hypothetical protein
MNIKAEQYTDRNILVSIHTRHGTFEEVRTISSPHNDHLNKAKTYFHIDSHEETFIQHGDRLIPIYSIMYVEFKEERGGTIEKNPTK